MTNTILVKDVMSKPATIAKSVPVTEALEKMIDIGTDPLIVVHNDEVVGTVSRSKIAEKMGTKHSTEVSPTAIRVSNVIDTDFTIVYEDQEIDVLITLLQSDAKIAVVYDADSKLIGQVSYSDLLSKIQPEGTAADVMEPVATIDAGERLVHLRRRMVDEKIARFIAMENGQIAGIVTETDVAVAITKFREEAPDKHQDKQVRNILVKDIMTPSVISVEKNKSTADIIALMNLKKISGVTVYDGGKIAGIVTRHSLVQAL